MSHRLSSAESRAQLEALRARGLAMLDQSTWPQITPDWSIDDFPSSAALLGASADSRIAWALARRVELAVRHPSWKLDVTPEQLETWWEHPAAMPLAPRAMLAWGLKLLNPPWAPLCQLVQKDVDEALMSQRRDVERALVTTFGAHRTIAFFHAEVSAFMQLLYRVNVTHPPTRAFLELRAATRQLLLDREQVPS